MSIPMHTNKLHTHRNPENNRMKETLCKLTTTTMIVSDRVILPLLRYTAVLFYVCANTHKRRSASYRSALTKREEKARHTRATRVGNVILKDIWETYKGKIVTSVEFHN